MTFQTVLQKPEEHLTRNVNLAGPPPQIAQPAWRSEEETAFFRSVQSAHPSSNVTLKTIHGMANVVPVLVFIPIPIQGDLVDLQKVLADSLHHIDGAKLTEIVEKELAHLQRPNRDDTVAFGDVTVDFVTMEAFRSNEPVVLTTLQFKTLRYLTRHAKRVVSRDELLNEVWGYERYPTTRTVDNVILKLRQQLESNPSQPVHLRTIYGAGYQFLP